jgi:hypothetical protein
VTDWADPKLHVERDSYEGRDPREVDTVDSKELMALTGATYRQIDYWCSQGYIQAVGGGSPGSGNRRRFSKSVVAKVKLVVRVSNAFSRGNSPLGAIFEHYEDESVDLGHGIHLTWDLVEVEER